MSAESRREPRPLSTRQKGSEGGSPAPERSADAEFARVALVAELEAAVGLQDGEALDRAYVFEPVERREVSFTLALVTKRLGGDRLEMVAVGGRAEGERTASHDFVRRARFPAAVLPEILAEFIDRCGVEGALYREVPLTGGESTEGPLDRLAGLLAPAGDGP